MKPLTEDFIEEVVEYLLDMAGNGPAQELLESYEEHGATDAWATAITEYLKDRADCDHDGESYRPNEEMKLLSSMTFEEDKAYWGALYAVEKANGITHMAYRSDHPVRIAAEDEIRQAGRPLK